MRILGIDPGSRVCGYGVVDERGGVLSYVECGVLTAPEERPMEMRLGEIARGLREVITELAPEACAVEDVFTHQNPRSALALALGASQRTAQRSLDSLAEAGKVQSFGRGRARRWMTPPVPGFTTPLLLPSPLPNE